MGGVITWLWDFVSGNVVFLGIIAALAAALALLAWRYEVKTEQLGQAGAVISRQDAVIAAQADELKLWDRLLLKRAEVGNAIKAETGVVKADVARAGVVLPSLDAWLRAPAPDYVTGLFRHGDDADRSDPVDAAGGVVAGPAGTVPAR
jgi:hypothetical protein